MEYKLRPLEYNGLRGKIGEQLARSFVRNVLAPRLVEQEGWDHVLLGSNDYKQRSKTWSKKLFDYDCFREDFIAHGFSADVKLLSKYATVVGALERNHCTPDGLLLKLKETGKVKRLKERDCPAFTRLRIKEFQKDGDCFLLPMVEGDVEVVEIKCGRAAKLFDKQKEAYNCLIAKSVCLRMIKVRIVSFDLNRFLVEERRYDRFL